MSSMHETSFEQVYQDYYPCIYHRVYTLMQHHQDAEDLTQETFLKAYNVFATLEVKKVGAWLYRVATNTTYDVLRRRRLIAFPSLDADDGERMHPVSGDLQEDVAEREAITAALSQIQRSYREVLLLQKVEGYTIEEIAHLQGRGYDATKTLAYHARRSFREYYEREVQACHSQ